MHTTIGHGKIAQLVRNRLAQLPHARETSIQVDERGGIVTLSGRVTTYHAFYAAQEAAARVHGVKHVINELDVSEAPQFDE